MESHLVSGIHTTYDLQYSFSSTDLVLEYDFVFVVLMSLFLDGDMLSRV